MGAIEKLLREVWRDKGGRQIAGLGHAVLYAPTQAQLQAAIDVGGGTIVNPRVIYVYGDISVYQVTLRSHLRIVFVDSTITCSASPGVGLADDPTNALFIADRTMNSAKIDQALTAHAWPGQMALSVASVGTLAPGDWLYVNGKNDTTLGAVDGFYESGPTPETQAELLQVATASGGTITLKTPNKVFKTSVGTPWRVQACTPIENVEIIGGTFDCAGKNVAVGISLRGARLVRVTGAQARGFSRSFVEAREGCWGVEVSRYRRLGGSNADFLATASHDLSAVDWDFDPAGDYTHPQGYVRGSFSMRTRCVRVLLERMRMGRCGCAMEIFGGHEVRARNLYFHDLDGNQKAGRFEPGTDLGGRCGVAIWTGCTSITKYTEYGQGFDFEGIFGSEIKTAASQCVIYWHDVFANSLRNVKLRHYGVVADAPGLGIVVSDSHTWGSELQDIQISSYRKPLVVENAGGPIAVRNYQYLATSYGPLGDSNFENVDQFAVYLVPNSSAAGSVYRWSGILPGSVGIFDISGMGDGDRDPVLYGWQVSESFAESVGYVGTMRFVRLSGVSFEKGAIVQLDTTAGASVRRMVAAAAGPQIRCWVLQDLVGGGTHALALEPGQHGVVLVASAQAVKCGDTLVHGTGGRAVVDNSVVDPNLLIGRATSTKAAGSESKVWFTCR